MSNNNNVSRTCNLSMTRARDALHLKPWYVFFSNYWVTDKILNAQQQWCVWHMDGNGSKAIRAQDIVSQALPHLHDIYDRWWWWKGPNDMSASFGPLVSSFFFSSMFYYYWLGTVHVLKNLWKAATTERAQMMPDVLFGPLVSFFFSSAPI